MDQAIPIEAADASSQPINPTNTGENATATAPDAYAGFIKDIWLEVPGYKFEHRTFDEKDNPKWVGRDEITDKLESYLKDGPSGAYLITGYRGMGKTSFVRRAINRYKDSASRRDIVREVVISFGQKDLKELDVLRQIIKGMMLNILPHHRIGSIDKSLFSYKSIPVWAGFVFIWMLVTDGHPITFIKQRESEKHKTEQAAPASLHTPSRQIPSATWYLPLGAGEHGQVAVPPRIPPGPTEIVKPTPENAPTDVTKEPSGKQEVVLEWAEHDSLWNKLKSPHGFEIAGALLIISLLCGFLLFAFFKFLFRGTFSTLAIHERLEDMYERSISQITKEEGAEVSSEKLPFGLGDKMVKRFPIANPKEIENEIIEILKQHKIGDIGRNKKGKKPIYRAIEFKHLFFLLLVAATIAFIFLFSMSLRGRFSETFERWLSWPDAAFWHSLLSFTGWFSGHTWRVLIALFVHCMLWAVPILGLLIVIFNLVKIYQLLGIRKFIFVFDEIDKIDATKEHERFDEDLDSFEMASHHTHLTEVRERRKAVIGILANLKYLITTANAKFIFIAGREMFDAALADVADRHSAISSIFHQVINVDSFLKNEENTTMIGKTAGVTKLVEDFLEKVLLKPYLPVPPKPKQDRVSRAWRWIYRSRKAEEPQPSSLANETNETFLRNYADFLTAKIKDTNLRDGTVKGSEQARSKVIYAMQSLIIYLTYRSNGSPKKLVRLLESLMRPSTDIDAKGNGFFENDKSIYLNAFRQRSEKNGPKKYYLHLGYYNQYRFGFINYMFRPFLSINANYYKSYSDKILVSTPFLFDHIFKFHQFAFSLQNLELVPEVLSEARSPELRNFIEDIVAYLNNSHIREAHIGLFDYKFYHRTFHEIEYLCKIYEDESAAFNFSLDENYGVKLHLSNRIKELRSVYKSFVGETPQDTHIASISFLNEILGNAQFFDGEYDEAIISYQDAAQSLELHIRGKDEAAFDFEKVLSYIILKLKLALTYEKIKDYDKAYSVYSEIFLRAETHLVNVPSAIKKGKSIKDFDNLLEHVVQPLAAALYLQEKMDREGASLPVIRQSADRLSALITKLLGTNSRLAGTLRASFATAVGTLLYYKNGSDDNCERDKDDKLVFQEFHGLTCLQTVRAEYMGNHNDAAESLRSDMGSSGDEIQESGTQEDKQPVQDEPSIPATRAGYSPSKRGQRWHDYRVSASAYSYLREALGHLIACGGHSEKLGDNTGLIGLLQRAEDIISAFIGTGSLHENARPELSIRHDKAYLRSLATILYKLGDCLYCSVRSEEQNAGSVRGNRLEKDDKHPYIHGGRIPTGAHDKGRWSFHTFNATAINDAVMAGEIADRHQADNLVLQIVLCLYYWSGQLFKHIGKNQSCSLMYRKILQTFRMLAHPQTIQDYDSVLRDEILLQIKLVCTWNTAASDKYQANKFLYALNRAGTDNDAHIREAYLNTSGSAELRECLILFAEMELKVSNEARREAALQKAKALISQYNPVTTQTIRYHELRLQVHINELELEKALNGIRLKTLIRAVRGKTSTLAELPHSSTLPIETISNIIANSIYSLQQIINIYTGFGLNYYMSYYSFGHYQQRLGNWLSLYEVHQKKDRELPAILEKLLSKDLVRVLNWRAAYQLALQHYSRARQLHSEGNPYKSLAVNMYYLEDDFNDGMYNFGLATERQRINSEILRRDILTLRELEGADYLVTLF